MLDKMGFDLSKNPYALNETIRIFIRTILPFIILIVVSWLTRPDDKERLDRLYARLKTPVTADREFDAKEVELSYANPSRFDHKKMFRHSNWEFEKFDKTDIKGIVISSIGALFILLLLYLIIHALG